MSTFFYWILETPKGIARLVAGRCLFGLQEPFRGMTPVKNAVPGLAEELLAVPDEDSMGRRSGKATAGEVVAG